MKTLAQLKRDAYSGRLSLEMIERYGKTGSEIPERLRGIRKVIGANTVCIKLLNLDGAESKLPLPNARLVDYTDDELLIYEPAQREPNEQEQRTLKEAKRIYKDCAWKVKDFLRQSDCPWMSGEKKIQGKRYLTWKGKVLDNSIRGNVILRYKVYMD